MPYDGAMFPSFEKISSLQWCMNQLKNFILKPQTRQRSAARKSVGQIRAVRRPLPPMPLVRTIPPRSADPPSKLMHDTSFQRLFHPICDLSVRSRLPPSLLPLRSADRVCTFTRPPDTCSLPSADSIWPLMHLPPFMPLTRHSRL